jgi:hypothetical protein
VKQRLFHTNHTASNDLWRGTFAAILSHNPAAYPLLLCDLKVGEKFEESEMIVFAAQ